MYTGKELKTPKDKGDADIYEIRYRGIAQRRQKYII